MNKIFLVQDDPKKKSGIIPAIVCGHMTAPALYASTDVSVFAKSDKEKGELLTAKLHYKEDMRRHYGKDYKRYSNIPSNQFPTIQRTF